jgi:hypothetical protein
MRYADDRSGFASAHNPHLPVRRVPLLFENQADQQQRSRRAKPEQEHEQRCDKAHGGLLVRKRTRDEFIASSGAARTQRPQQRLGRSQTLGGARQFELDPELVLAIERVGLWLGLD